jgi:hypothetical protein
VSASFVGKERLSAVLDGGQRIVVSNRTTLNSGVRIQAIALGLHVGDGSIRFRTAASTALEAHETTVIDDDRPIDNEVVATEALLRLAVRRLGRILDAYVKINTEGTASALGDVELGISELDIDPIDGAIPIDDAPGLAVFARTLF